MKKAAAYCRYSSDKQQQQSIEYQLEQIKQFCKTNRITLIAEYSDEAKSGTSDNRENFQQMIEESKTSEWEFLIVYNLSRLSRNVQDQMFYQKTLQQRGVLVISTEEQFDARTAEGSFFNLITAGMNEYYSKHLAKRSWGGVMQNANKALVIGGLPPLGYDVGPDKKYVINEQEAAIVRFIFDKTVEGWSYSRITSYLNENGFRNKRGNSFSKAHTDILKNRKYIGEYVFNRTQKKTATGKRNVLKPESEILRIPGGIPVIVEEATFNQVQKILQKRKRSNHRGLMDSSYLLTGLLECEQCGYSYNGNISFNRHWNYPRITYRHGRSKNIDCKMKDIPQKRLDYWVEKIVLPELLSAKYVPELHRLIKEQTKEQVLETKQKIKLLEDNLLARKERIKETLETTTNKNSYLRDEVDLLISSNIEDTEEISELMKSLEDRRVIAQKEIRGWQRENKLKVDKFGTKAFLKSIIDRITISNEKIKVYIKNPSSSIGMTYIIKNIERKEVMKLKIKI